MKLHPILANLRDLRHASHHTADTLANQIGKCAGTLTAWETGRRQPTVADADLVLRALGYRLAVVPLEPGEAMTDA